MSNVNFQELNFNGLFQSKCEKWAANKYGIILLLIGLIHISVKAQNLQVITSNDVLADMAQNLAGNIIDVTSISLGDKDQASLKPLLEKADLILIPSYQHTHTQEKFLQNLNSKSLFIPAKKEVAFYDSPFFEQGINPHVWMDAQNGMIYIRNIKDGFSDLDSINTYIYGFNYQVYYDQLVELDSFIQKELNAIPENNRVLISNHKSLQYFASRYGLSFKYFDLEVFEGKVKSKWEKYIKSIIQEYGVPIIFVDQIPDNEQLKILSKTMGIQFIDKLFFDLNAAKDKSVNSYTELLRHNTITIKQSLINHTIRKEPDKKKDWKFYIIFITLITIIISTLFIRKYI